jgi:hypothetical protein
MKQNIPSLIAFCNRSILTWYKKEFPLELKMGEFTPVNKNDEDIVETIYQMYLILKSQNKTNVQLLMPVVKYYFAVAVVEYYVLDNMCPLFMGVITKQMVDFSMNPELSQFRKKMMGFSEHVYPTRTIKMPYKIKIETKNKTGISL